MTQSDKLFMLSLTYLIIGYVKDQTIIIAVAYIGVIYFGMKINL